MSPTTRGRVGAGAGPFLIVGAILTAVTMPVLWWMPHGLPPWAMFGWLLVAGILLYSCFSVWAMPYYSLQLEMSPDYNERTNIGSYRAFFMQFFGVGAGWVLAFCRPARLQPVAGAASRDLANGMRYISLGLAALVILLGVLPGLFVPERYYEKETSRQKKEPFWQGFRQTFSTRPFLWILVIVFSKTFGFGLTGTLGFYLSTYYVCRGDLTLATLITGSAATATFLPNLVAIPFCTWVANRWDKKNAALSYGFQRRPGLVIDLRVHHPGSSLAATRSRLAHGADRDRALAAGSVHAVRCGRL